MEHAYNAGPTRFDLSDLKAMRKPRSLRVKRVKNRILRSFVGVRPGAADQRVREWTLHATKGWRSRRP